MRVISSPLSSALTVCQLSHVSPRQLFGGLKIVINLYPLEDICNLFVDYA